MKLASLTLLAAVLGVALGIGGTSYYLEQQNTTHPLAEANTVSITPNSPATTIPKNTSQTPQDTVNAFRDTNGNLLLQTAFFTLTTLEQKNYETLATLVHPEKGVRFTPYSTVNLEADICLTPQQIKTIAQDTTLYSWGAEREKDTPISMTIEDYLGRYVTNLNYYNAPNIATDMVILRGNALENIIESYPGCRFVDFSFPSLDPEAKGTDWSSLKLVFEAGETAWYLVGVVHGTWTS